ncbi:hypothetical protein [Schaalia sp. ZJ1691]|uniref:hypothetical protein n=1 Tax=Schaalia sp. ZJ1691 TaxID=2709404 RepID=UPI0013ECE2CD|nr:hypothetical protein [Schaalia sp. ZJ1691]
MSKPRACKLCGNILDRYERDYCADCDYDLNREEEDGFGIGGWAYYENDCQ